MKYPTCQLCFLGVQVRESWINIMACHSKALDSKYIRILVPRGRAFFGSTKNRDLWPDFLSTRREFVSYSQPIRFDRLDSEHAQSAEKSMNHGLPVLDQARGRYSWCWSRDARPLDEKGIYAKRVSHNYQVHLPVEFKFWDLFFVPFSTCWAFNLLLFRCRKDFHATVRVNFAWLSAGGKVMHKNSHPVWSFSRGCTAFFDITPLSELRKKRHP